MLNLPCHRIELGSMAYLTGLAQSTETADGLATVMGIISAESKRAFSFNPISCCLLVAVARHLTWVNSAVLAGDPFVGPSDTYGPFI
jgi:hypothetical protein